MISNILLTCLIEDCKLDLAQSLSKKLDMIFADIDELVKFDVINPELVIEKVSVEYFKSIQKKQVKNVSSYENSLIVASDEILTETENFNILKNTSLTIFVKVPFKKYAKYIKEKCNGILQPSDIIDLNMFYDKEKIFSKNANIVVDAKWLNIKHLTRKVVKEIKKYYVKK